MTAILIILDYSIAVRCLNSRCSDKTNKPPTIGLSILSQSYSKNMYQVEQKKATQF